nr:MAG TPA: hypothetical protein [Caudoviricetes sp.]
MLRCSQLVSKGFPAIQEHFTMKFPIIVRCVSVP